MNDENLLLGIVVATATTFILLTGTLAILYTAYKARLRQQTALAATRITYEQELRTIAAEVSEQTMASIGRELHDNICNRLVVLNTHLEILGLKNPNAAPALKPATDALSIAYNQARLLSHSLNTDVVTGSGLPAMLEKEIGRLQALGQNTVHWQHDGEEPDLSPDARLVAFRIFQEAVRNALKHAPRATLFVQLRTAPHFLLSIRDEGPGFDTGAALNTTAGAGLRTMQRRAALAAMQCSITSAPGVGTTVVLQSAA